MFEIEKRFTFHAAHQLLHHDGPCSRLHGHTYELIVRIQAQSLIPDGPKTNMVIDFQDFKMHVRALIDKHLEHQFLNDTLATDSPTAEFIAAWIYKELKKTLPGLTSLSLFESPTSGVTYSE
jgi:6-pyruvoyltetrahydropterin/6-carboxytetrahydropterin synthase